MNGKAGSSGGRSSGSSSTSETSSSSNDYKVKVSTRFLFLSFTVSILAAFAVGRTARLLLLSPAALPVRSSERGILPPPVAQDGKPIPHTIYTSKNFDTARSSSSSLLIRPSEDDSGGEPAETCASAASTDDDEEHLPAGQHLLVDIKGVDSAFLDSESRLAHAMVEVVNQAALTLLSYHCHTLVPNGVSCVGVLLESHVSFHTWPAAGVITLDLFTCGSNPLVPVVPMIQRLFAVPPPSSGAVPKVAWSHKLRGFRGEDHKVPLQNWDLNAALLSVMDMEYKNEIYSVQTDFQRIDIYDMISKRFNSHENYQRSLSNDGSYYAKNPKYFSPDRVILLDGIAQSRSKGEHCYHESLVHPAMLAHPHPKSVAIIGGGEGATLREVLKHKTIERAVMVEIDEQMVAVSRQHIPEWSDCSDLVGSADWCGDDARAEMYYEDAIAWFIDRYLDNDGKKNEPFDVIIMDALDPHFDVDFAVKLYNNDRFLRSLFNALSEDGVLVAQVGESANIIDPPEMVGKGKNRVIMIELLEKIGFKNMHLYGQGHGGYTSTWNNIVATKSKVGRKNWYRNEAEVNLEIHQRLVKSKSSTPLLEYFDGATMQFFQVPIKGFEAVHCKIEPTPEECLEHRGFDPEIPNISIDNFEVKTSEIGTRAGRGLYTKVDIPKRSYISAETAVHNVFFPPSTFKLLIAMDAEVTEEVSPIEYYMNGYGFQSENMGDKEVTVDSTITTFANHGCNGAYNLGDSTGEEFTELNVDLEKMPNNLQVSNYKKVYSPVSDRNLRMLLSGSDCTLRDIKAGEEVLTNYLTFVGTPDDWKGDVQDLRDQCSGVGVGDVLEYEEEEAEQNAQTES